MSDDIQAAEADTAKKPEQARGRSTIEFPYLDLSNAMEVAHAVKAVGGTSADWPQIAIKLSMQADGGAFRLRILTARVFGIVDNDRGHVELTDLGIRIVDPQYERAAKVEAFMRVQLFKAPAATSLTRARGLPRSAWGTAFAHAGVGVMLLGIVGETAYKQETIVQMKPGDSVSVVLFDSNPEDFGSVVVADGSAELDALKERDSHAAELAMERHIQEVKEWVLAEFVSRELQPSPK